MKIKKNQGIFLLYWLLLAYIITALVFWYISLNRQNAEMTQLRKESYLPASEGYEARLQKIEDDKQRKVKQYAGEGATFLLVIVAGATFMYWAIRKQLKTTQQQKEFMMAVTHELKTPIAVATLNLETIQKRKLDESQQQRLIQNTLLETNRLNALCNNLLISSQIEAGGYNMQHDELDFSALISDAVKQFVHRYPQREINEAIRENVYLNGDAFLLQIMINNLLDNALKYSPKESAIEVVLDKDSTLVHLQVKDHGPGIAMEEREKVFQKFYRMGNEATKKAKGTGLGLYLTRRIVQHHKGQIRATDNTARGSIFVVEFPAID